MEEAIPAPPAAHDGVVSPTTTTTTAMASKLNTAVHDSFIGKYFLFEERKAAFTQEFTGGTATFMSMAYILAVNPRILSESGGPCLPSDDDGGIFGPSYLTCIEHVKREYITSTALASMFGCFCMGLLANLPIGLAPGMGMNAYFTYTVVGWRGTGSVAFETGVTAVLIEGCIFLVLAVTGMRYAITKLIPEPVRKATPAAIGFFLAHIGLQTAEGIGIVVADIATGLTLGGCPLSKRTKMVALTESCAVDPLTCVTSDQYTCDDLGGVMTSGTTWVGILGLMIVVILMAYKQRSAFIVGIGFITAISWFRNTAISYFPDTPEGDARFDYFTQFARIEPLNQLLANFSSDFDGVWGALATFVYIDFLDTSGTLLALASTLNLVTADGDFPRSRFAFSSDALATIFGSMFSLTPVTSYIESGAGIEAGARTGLTAIIVGLYFFLSLFFAPIIASIPAWATGGALVVVGALMSRSLAEIKWYNITHAATAFLTVTVMPLTYSIAYGLIAGIGCYIIMTAVFKMFALLGIEEPRFEPPTDNNDVINKLIKSEKETHREGAIKSNRVLDDDDDQPEATA